MPLRPLLVLLTLAVTANGAVRADQGQSRPPRARFELAAAERPKHIAVASSVTPAAAIAPGERVTLRLAVEPGPRIHVYAPGETKYQVIALAIADTAGVRLEAPRFPPAESLFFAPLAETVLVYSKPFEIVQDLALDGSAATRKALADKKELTVRGTLSYQACDDKVCFLPTQTTVEWRIALRTASQRPSPK